MAPDLRQRAIRRRRRVREGCQTRRVEEEEEEEVDGVNGASDGFKELC